MYDQMPYKTLKYYSKSSNSLRLAMISIMRLMIKACISHLPFTGVVW